MTANLLTVTEEKREFSMNRDLMPAITLTTLKKIAFTLLCCVLMVLAAPAQTPQQVKADPGNNNPPPAGPILDLSGTPIPGGGNSAYQMYTVSFTAGVPNTAITFALRDDPAFISLANVSVTDLTHPSGNLLLNGDFSGGTHSTDVNNFIPNDWTYVNIYGATFGGVVDPNCRGGLSEGNFCWFDGAVQAYDAISQPITTAVGDIYQISFSVAENSNCACNFSDISTNGDVTDPGGNGINVAVYAQGGLPVVTVTQQGAPIDPNVPGSLTQQFVLPTTGGQVAYGFDFSHAVADALIVQPGTTPFVGFSGITPSQYQTLVAGTALEGTACLTASGLKDGSGNPLCALTSLTATTTANPTASGANLPQSTCVPGPGQDNDILCARNILLTHTLDLDIGQPGMTDSLLNIPPGTAPGMAEFNDVGSCPYPVGDPLFGHPCPGSIMTSIQDGPTKPGGTPKPAGSSTVLMCCEPEWATTVGISPWNNNPANVPVTFTNTPPASAHPAQALGVLYGAASVPVDTTIPDYPGEKIALVMSQPPAPPAVIPCPTLPNPQVPIPFNVSGSLTQFDSGTTAGPLVDGVYSLLYAVVDCAEFINLKYPPSIDFGGNGLGPNLAQWNTTTFGVDTMAPTVGAITLNPPGGVYAQGTTVKASFTCTDPLKGGVASGIASCVGNTTNYGSGNPVPVNNAVVPTGTIGGPQTFTATATDVAGNVSAPSSVTYQVVGPADLAIGMLASPWIKTGQNLTYLIVVANKGPNAAATVVVNDTLPANTTFVNSGFAIESCTIGNGPPNCSFSPPTNSCGVSPGSCNIGPLPAWTKNNPIGVLVQITVKVNARPYTTIKNTAVVGETNADPNPNNNTATWQTFVLR